MANSAYLHKKEELDKFFEDAFAGNKPSAAYLAAHETGQSTWMLGYVADLATSSNAGPVVYVSQHQGEAELEYQRRASIGGENNYGDERIEFLLGSKNAEPYSTGQVVFCDYTNVPWGSLVGRYVMIVDVELYCTTAGELFFCSLLEECRDSVRRGNKDDTNSSSSSSDGSVPTVLCVAARVSKRTTDALGRWIPDGVTVIEVPDNRKPLEPEIIPDNEYEQTVLGILGGHRHRQDPGLAVLLSNEGLFEEAATSKCPGMMLHTGSLLGKTLLDLGIQNSGVAVFRQELGFVAECPQLSLLISRQQRKMWTYHTGTSILRLEQRSLGFWGIRKEEDWIRKTQQGPDKTRYLVGGRREQDGKLKDSAGPDDVDPLGPAYEGDLLITLLQLTDKWAGLHMSEWPVRPIPDLEMAAEGLRRLSMMGCIYQPEVGSVGLTQQGVGVLEFNERLTARSHFPVPRVRRVLVLMALFVELLENQDSPLVWIQDPGLGGAEQFRDNFTLGTGQRLFHHGWLWMALGYFVWQYKTLGVAAETPAKEISHHFGIHANVPVATNVLEGYRSLASVDYLADLDCPDLRDGTDLTDPEVVEVQSAFIDALHNKCVMVRNCPAAERTHAVDILSWRDVSINFDHETMQAMQLRQDNKDHGGFVALYHKVEVPDKPADPLHVQYLTHVPRDLCLRLGHKNEQEFPWCCQTIYPLH
ncbi:hypothetical protein PG993_006151 [Apiospora rasikravindrae]|uniref:Uncharacterized protein n=1 Tax=Apiospora rasikravindrae TaxID=990691 RepID=A0ABR1T7D2_9PEZI